MRVQNPALVFLHAIELSSDTLFPNVWCLEQCIVIRTLLTQRRWQNVAATMQPLLLTLGLTQCRQKRSMGEHAWWAMHWATL